MITGPLAQEAAENWAGNACGYCRQIGEALTALEGMLGDYASEPGLAAPVADAQRAVAYSKEWLLHLTEYVSTIVVARRQIIQAEHEAAQ